MIFALVVNPHTVMAGTSLKVGIYNSRPMVFQEKSEKPKGVFIDVLEYIAAEEGWTLEYVPGTWGECLERLKKDEIAILPGIAFSKERAELFDFSAHAVISTWGQIYTSRVSGLESVLDLEGRTVAVLKDDFYETEFQNLLDAAGIEAHIAEVLEYDHAFQMVADGRAYACAVERLSGLSAEKTRYNLQKSPIIYSPGSVRFGFAKGRHQEIREIVDAHLSLLKSDPDSLYYQSLEKWLGGAASHRLPAWFVYLLVFGGLFFVSIVAVTFLLKSQVEARTRELAEKNEELEQEIAERRQAVNALLTSEEKYRLLVENQTDLVIRLDLEGRLTFASPSFCNCFSLLDEQVADFDLMPLVHEDDRGLVESSLLSVLDPPYTHYGELRMSTRDGWRWLGWTNNAVFDPYGRIVAITSVGRDITDQRNLEAQLQQAQKMEAIGTLAGGIAHDFNNLLMGIQGNLSLILLNADHSHPDYERLKNIEHQVESGSDLTSQLLGFARRGQYLVRPTDINHLMNKTVSMFGRTRKDILIRENYSPDLWAAEVDQVQLEQVLLNLYVNAWQAMPEGGEIIVATENAVNSGEPGGVPGLQPGRYVRISVTDTGMGMDEATRKRIFEPFFTTKELGRGTGLGLASAYGIVKNHGGAIDVRSEKGKGSTFEVYIPATDKEIERITVGADQLIKGHGRILLVDDEAMVLEVGAEMAALLGYDVLTAATGEEALKIFQANRHNLDLVILDMIMPKMSGGEVFDRMKLIRPDVKVLLSTGYSLGDEARAILQRGCLGFIQKPFSLKKFSVKIDEVLRK